MRTDPIPKSHNLYPLYRLDLASQCNVFSNGFLQQINLVSGNGIILVLPHRRHWPVHKAKRLSSLSASFNNTYTQIPLFRDCYFLSGPNSSLYRLINALWACFFLMYLQCNSPETICWGWYLFWNKTVGQDDLGREEAPHCFSLLLCSADYKQKWKSFTIATRKILLVPVGLSSVVNLLKTSDSSWWQLPFQKHYKNNFTFSKIHLKNCVIIFNAIKRFIFVIECVLKKTW